jgi:hypothetical protein
MLGACPRPVSPPSFVLERRPTNTLHRRSSACLPSQRQVILLTYTLSVCVMRPALPLFSLRLARSFASTPSLWPTPLRDRVFLLSFLCLLCCEFFSAILLDTLPNLNRILGLYLDLYLNWKLDRHSLDFLSSPLRDFHPGQQPGTSYDPHTSECMSSSTQRHLVAKEYVFDV